MYASPAGQDQRHEVGGQLMTPLERLYLEIEAAILDVHDQDATLSLYAEAAAKAALDEVRRMLKDGVDMTEGERE